MLLERGIKMSERDAANLLFDAKAGKDVRGPALSIPAFIASLLEEPVTRTTTEQYLPKHRAHAPDLPFEVPRRVRMAFDAYDKDNSGFLEGDEIVAALWRYGVDATSDSGRALTLGSMDVDNQLNFSQFALLVGKLEEQARLERQVRHMESALTPRATSGVRYVYGDGSRERDFRPL